MKSPTPIIAIGVRRAVASGALGAAITATDAFSATSGAFSITCFTNPPGVSTVSMSTIAAKGITGASRFFSRMSFASVAPSPTAAAISR
jgi:hypothetical protein